MALVRFFTILENICIRVCNVYLHMCARVSGSPHVWRSREDRTFFSVTLRFANWE